MWQFSKPLEHQFLSLLDEPLHRVLNDPTPVLVVEFLDPPSPYPHGRGLGLHISQRHRRGPYVRPDDVDHLLDGLVFAEQFDSWELEAFLVDLGRI